MWNRIETAVDTTLQVFFEQHHDGYDGWVLPTPKILGFDSVVSTSDAASTERLQPWLIEINRFLGLEPRKDDGPDGHIKRFSLWKTKEEGMSFGSLFLFLNI